MVDVGGINLDAAGMEVGLLFRELVGCDVFVTLQCRDWTAENVKSHCSFDEEAEKV
jgi:hypothetical protein